MRRSSRGDAVPDECDIAAGASQDLDGNGIPDECEGIIPAVSQWGLVILALLLLTGMKTRYGQRQPVEV